MLEAARRFEDEPDWPTVDRYRSLLGGRCPVDFRVAEPRGRGRARAGRRAARISYDASICDALTVPTRARSWHDLFNALVWGTFPRTKSALHRRQHDARSASAEPGRRTREQDALALLDEGGVALLCEDSCWPAASAAVEDRGPERIAPLSSTARVLGVVYGHAIYEHLGCGGPTVRAMVHLVRCREVPREPAACIALADDALASALADPESFIDPDLLRSLPVRPEVLGVPAVPDRP